MRRAPFGGAPHFHMLYFFYEIFEHCHLRIPRHCYLGCHRRNDYRVGGFSEMCCTMRTLVKVYTFVYTS